MTDMQEVMQLLDRVEPDYSRAAHLPNVTEHLLTIVRICDPFLASRALYVAGMIPDKNSIGLVEEASKSKHVVLNEATIKTIKELKKSGQFSKQESAILNDILDSLEKRKNRP